MIVSSLLGWVAGVQVVPVMAHACRDPGGGPQHFTTEHLQDTSLPQAFPKLPTAPSSPSSYLLQRAGVWEGGASPVWGGEGRQFPGLPDACGLVTNSALMMTLTTLWSP